LVLGVDRQIEISWNVRNHDVMPLKGLVSICEGRGEKVGECGLLHFDVILIKDTLVSAFLNVKLLF